MTKKILGIYIHIPFCRSKCLYCAFNSVAVDGFSSKEWAGYLEDEISFHLRGNIFKADTHVLKSIYFGGGTPSLLSPAGVADLVSSLKERFSFSDGLEVTLEANPDGLGIETLEGFLQAGVNRLSLGLQSLNDNELRLLGRRHGADEALMAVERARRVGFDNLSLDLMYGLPGQTLSGWAATLEAALSTLPSHISLYNLSVEEDTPFYERYGGAGQNPFVDEELELAMYKRAMETLAARGYCHYEISNFSLPGFKSIHNEGYWLGREYLGIGPGAHSFSRRDRRGRRFWNETEIENYKSALSRGSPVAGSETLTRDEAMVEAVLLGLRMLERGIDIKSFSAKFGKEAGDNLLARCRGFEEAGFVHIHEDKVVLDRSVYFTSNEICLSLVS